MFRFLSACALSVMFVTSVAQAADLPMQLPKHVHAKIIKKKVKVATAKVAAPAKHVATVVAPLKASAPTPDAKVAAVPAKIDSVNLSWTLDPLVANADGGKNEGSASVIGNLILDKAGQKFGPLMTIELVGHIVKTPESVVRIDIQIGTIKRTVTWNADEVKSGTFKIVLDEKLPVGMLPQTLPASALAFVIKKGDGRAAMVSLEKINLHMSKLRIAGGEEE